MEEFITVLSLGKPYDFQPEGQAEHLTGCTMFYIPTGDLTPFKDTDTGVLGFQPLKQTMGVDFYNIAESVGLPCRAKVHYGMKNSGGKQVLYIKGLDFVPVKSK